MTDVLPAPSDTATDENHVGSAGDGEIRTGGRALSLPVAAEQADASRYPFSIPFGWFQVAWSSELVTQTRPLRRGSSQELTAGAG